MKKIYSKRQLAELIIEANTAIFIPFETLVLDLDHVYKIRKIAKKILRNDKYCDKLLLNHYKIATNIFGNNLNILYSVIMSDEEINVINVTINNLLNNTKI
jgi:hypothetical protein